MFKSSVAAGVAVALMLGVPAHAADIDVTHWWGAGSDKAAVAELARAFDATGNRWVDDAVGASFGEAYGVILSRILSGKPMGATLFVPGKDAGDLVAAGLMLDLTELAAQEDWRASVNPQLLDPCTFGGKVFCLPVSLHTRDWMWINRHVYESNGLAVPANWNEFLATAPQLQAKGIAPLAMASGRPTASALGAIELAVLGRETYVRIRKDRDIALAAGPEGRRAWEALDAARKLVDPAGSAAQWQDAVAQVARGEAAASIMGDAAGGELVAAGLAPGSDFDCLPGLGLAPVLETGGDFFFFPSNVDPEVTKAQLVLASSLLKAETQLAFNLKRGALPVRSDVDVAAANDCVKQGLDILGAGAPLPPASQMLDADSLALIADLQGAFFADSTITIEQAQARFVEIIKNAPPL